jgi:hypothetical protein
MPASTQWQTLWAQSNISSTDVHILILSVVVPSNQPLVAGTDVICVVVVVSVVLSVCALTRQV